MASCKTNRVDGKHNDVNVASGINREREVDERKNCNMGLSSMMSPPNATSSSTTADANTNSTFQRYKDEGKINPEESMADSSSEPAPNSNREELHKLPIASCTRGSSKLTPSCPSPTHAADSPRTHVFSPQLHSVKPSNDRAEYDQLDLDDTMMGAETFPFEDASPQRNLGRPLSQAENVNEVRGDNFRKREASQSDFPYPTKRTQVFFTHHNNFVHSHEDSSGNVTSSSKIKKPMYYNFYGHAYPTSLYPGDSQTPSRGTHHPGAFCPEYSPYHGLYPEHSHSESRPFRTSIGSQVQYGSDEESPPSPPPSPGGRVSSANDAVSTPEKVLESIVAKSPFRSPPRDANWAGAESNNTVDYRPSPFFQRSPGISGSFDMGTPNGTLTVDGDNLGPIFEPFGDASTPCTLRSLEGAPLMNIVRSPSRGNSDDTPSPSAVGRDRQQERSPLARDMADLSSIDQPILHGNTRPSPNHDFDNQIFSNRRRRPESHRETIGTASTVGERQYPKSSVVTMSGIRGALPSSRLDPGARPKQLWPSSSDSSSQERSSSKGVTPGPVSLEIGGTGSLTTRKTFEGINSMMQPRSPTRVKCLSERKNFVSGQKTTSGRSQLPLRNHRSSHHPSYPVSEISTPRKSYNQIRSGHVRHQYSYPPFSGSGRKPIYPQKMDSHYSLGGVHKPMYRSHPHPRDGNPGSEQHHRISHSDGKENSKKKGVQKRSPCNCKKSRCLKLYCECFAAERFCQGCNCIDCGNTPESGEVREKAIKDTRAKNSKAFQNRFTLENSQGSKSAQKVHNMGCKCKKSACLKKYCECFNAGALCGAKCKCVDCLNYAGSQALIDKRRKIKDRSGAEYALRVSDEQWKSGCGSSGRKASVPPHRRHPMPSPVIMPPHHNMYPSPRGPPPQRSHSYSRHSSQHQYYMTAPPRMIAHSHPHTGYAPMNMSGTPRYHRPAHMMTPGERLSRVMYPPPPHSNRLSSTSKPVAKMTSRNPKIAMTSPKTPGIRKPFDPATSRMKRKTANGESEPTEPYFGGKINQPKTTALAVFSFFSNADLYHASLVCRRWGELAFDEELWKF